MSSNSSSFSSWGATSGSYPWSENSRLARQILADFLPPSHHSPSPVSAYISPESSRLTMSPPDSRSLDSFSTSSHSRVADPTYARPVPNDPFYGHAPLKWSPTRGVYRVLIHNPTSDVSTPGSTPRRHINRHRNPRDLLPEDVPAWDAELGRPMQLQHDRYERNPRFESPTPRRSSRFRPRPARPLARRVVREMQSLAPDIPQDKWWIDKKYGWQNACRYRNTRSVKTDGMVDISKLPQARERLYAMVAGHAESPGHMKAALTVGPIGGQPAKALPLTRPDLFPGLALARLNSLRSTAEVPVVPAGPPSEPSFVRSSAPSPSSQSFASDTFPPVPLPVLLDKSSELSFTTLLSSAFSDPTEYPNSDDTTDDAFLHEHSLIAVDDLPESPHPLTPSPTFVSTGVQVSPPTLASVGVQDSPPAPATLVSVSVQATPDPAPATKPSFLQRCWNWIDSKIRSWLF